MGSGEFTIAGKGILSCHPGLGMKQAAVIFCWICVAAAAAFLRFDELGTRPMHADEATGARITAQRMEGDGGRFDPRHYHGPLLADLAMPLCRLRGEDGWKSMTKTTLRLVPAIAGTLLVLVPLLGRRRFGDGPMLLAAALLATSPLLVYYSRMFIHEMLLTLAGVAALAFLTTMPRRGLPGAMLGLMFAAKETFVISVVAWVGAALPQAWESRGALASAWRAWRAPLLASLAAFVLTAALFYTHGFRHAQGAIDAVRTFFVYETVDGHQKPFGWYFQLLAVPHKSGGAWWFGTPVLLLALVACASTFRRGADAPKGRAAIRFLGCSVLGHFLIYSVIGYKTPWLACLPWAQVCLLAGFAVADWARWKLPVRAAVAFLTMLSLASGVHQSRLATGRLASDERNPFTYVPTRPDVEKLAAWLEELRRVAPAGSLDEAGVVGSDYWPLPWYLRSFEKTGYWRDLGEAPPQLAELPLVFAMPEAAENVMARLQHTHVSVPRGLRAGVPVELFVREDIWRRWMETDTP
jgi:uncharacterized protein (TIGR03663 family)